MNDFNPDGMVMFQVQRRAALAAGSAPATALNDNWFRPPAAAAAALRPMSSAPRDGSKITLHRKPHPNLKYPVVVGYWHQWSVHHGFWCASGIGGIGGDEYVIGWEEI